MLSVVTLCALGLGLTALLGLYLGRLPEAPLCPTCRGMTSEPDSHWPGGRTLSYVSTTVVRQCVCCGWRGRMRWRPSAHRVSTRQ